MAEIIINDRKIGIGCEPYIIAEACDNHMGDLDVAKEMALQAKLAGADCVKYQHHLPDEEMLPDVPMSSNFDIPLYEFLKLHALKLSDHVELKKYCDEIGITYLCTPFSFKAACELEEAGIAYAFKIGSGEMTDIPSLKKIAEFGKPMIISSGMCTLEELDRTYNALKDKGAPLAFTNCLSEYPPVYEDVNLGVLRTMQERYPDVVIGHSDHTPDLYTCYAAVAFGASIIEKHVILNKMTPGPDQTVSIDFMELRNLVDGCKKIYKSLGNEKKVRPKEEAIRQWAFRSIVSTCEIKAGTVITENMIWSKRPGTGIPSWKMDEVIGKTATKDIEKNVLINETDFA
ncbi:N-acetylneuraminate synthase family protein [Pseudobutyrivibrio xylanivorans]|uniref:N-acetylneuraminate synthase n=1 Tax=Pseudobutyrivibrio xylanivorans TaxID=185007 RepID=A0A1G5S4C5_PSEXY|nr:N-acetylneuraminate synthase family protein [Pseudobutyrivibrio xylanivorans]SCZ81214.1 N-acetylneuraminate synthase [Pseudobutyrivibrio xylanivorans]